jgi:chromate transporter
VAEADRTTRRRRLLELSGLFLRLGLTAFGGPAAHIAMMEDEVVRRRGWMSRDRFLDLLGATNLIPGPNSTEMAIHVGHLRAGLPGLAVAGTCFIVPATLLTLGLAWAYVAYGELPVGTALLDGVKPAIIAIVAQALFRLGQAALKGPWLVALALAATAAAALGVNELAVLFGVGGLAALRQLRRAGQALLPSLLPLGPCLGAAGGGPAASPDALFLVFAKIGSVLFGSGYVLLAFLRADLVERRHWMTAGQLIDAVAAGQVTPGPVFSTATFIGYLLAGLPGAAAATAGIFLPAFVFVALSAPLVPRLRGSRVVGAFLDGVNVASLALMAVVTVALARSAIVDAWTALLAFAGALALRAGVNSMWIVAAGALLGLARQWIG